VIYAVFRAGVRLIAHVVLGRRLHIEGMANVPRRGPVLIVGNHVGTVEPPLTGVFIPRLDVYYMAKSELFRNRALGWLFRRNHTFPVVRGSPDRAALRFALGVLGAGHVLLVYPEGTRSWSGDRAARSHAGAGFIARHSGAPVVPVASWGSERVIPRGAWLPKRADLTIRIGKPFSLPGTGPAGRPLGNQAAADLMMERVAALIAPEAKPSAPLGGESPPAA
jgi:1-acyl-sn-glycerol-3-phosphate acyltransferase